MFYNKTSLILKLKILPKNPVWMYYRNVILWLRGSVQCYRQFTGKDFFLNLIGIHIERTQRIHCLIQYTGGWAHISLMMFNDFKQTLLLFTHLFFIICLPINALNLFGFHVLECGTNTLATYPAFCTQPAGEGCRKNCNIVLTVICNIFFQVLK